MAIDPQDPGTVPMFPESIKPSKLAEKPGRVFVVQETELNLVRATKFGELISLLPGRLNITMNPAPVLRELKQKLKDFNDQDYILPIGDPIAIGLAFTVAMELNRGKFRALKWDKVANSYYVVNVDIHDRGRHPRSRPII